jgi:hypothetical protein
LATDRNCSLPPFGVDVVGSPVKVLAETRSAYKQSEDCILVRPREKNSPLFANLAVEDGLSRVATNRPSYLVRHARSLEVLATFPSNCWTVGERSLPEGFTRAPFARGEQGLVFAVGGDSGWGGRILILSDHSVFINAMMWQPDIDNFDFAYNCANWLTEGGKRRHVLFLEEGQVQQTFEIPLKEPPPPPLPSLKAVVETVDNSIAELEKENTFNRAIQKAVTNLAWPPDVWLRGLILIATLGLAVVGLARLTQARHRHEKVTPLPEAGSARTLAPPSLFEERNRSMLRNGNLWEAARALARQAFETALGSPFQAQRQASTAPPSLRLPGSWWRNWRWRRRIHRLWQLAYGTRPVRISSRRLRRLGGEIETLKTLLNHYGQAPGPGPPAHKQQPLE